MSLSFHAYGTRQDGSLKGTNLFSSRSGGVRRLLAIVPVFGLAAVGLPAAAAPVDTSVARFTPSATDHYINYSPPRVEPEERQPRLDRRGRIIAERFGRKHRKGNPITGRILAAREAEALRTGRNPAEFIFKKSRQTQTAKLLTLLVEFNEKAHDDFSGFRRPRTVLGDPEDCVTEPPGTRFSGPLHNRLPNPATLPRTDNNTLWVPDFNPAHYQRMLYSDTGITQRVRKDLIGPDGKRGIDLSGLTLKRLYEEMSKGAYSITGNVVGWIKVPHSEAWYAAAACGTFPQDMSGHPANPRGVEQLVIDAVNTLAAQRPDFPWSDYDREDVSDADDDGNYAEPDGVIDHLVIVHAGKDKSADGGAQGTYAIWSHSGLVTGGHTVPGTDIKIHNYIMQPEDAGVGIFAHEYGHDLGLPDLYDTTGGSSPATDFWDLMYVGSHAGPLYQTMPTHLGLWGKWLLGWADPVVLQPGDRPRTVTVGQSSRTPKNTADGVRVNLESAPVPMVEPHSGANTWWTNRGRDLANLKLTRDLAVPAGRDVRLWMWNNYDIESEWDYGFVEVSADGGATWTQQRVFAEDGREVTTPDDYPDENEILAGLGKKHGLTGTTDGWRHDYVDLTPYAGKTIKLRLTYNTDTAYTERGWHVDDFALTRDGVTVWSDDVEHGTAGWTATGGTFSAIRGEGWHINDGTQPVERFYLVEWRNLDGFDKGLAHAYDTTYLREGAWKVERIRYNAPGMLVWLRDASYTDNALLPNMEEPPSLGAKGSLLLVDSHFDPLRRKGAAAAKDPDPRDNLPGRVQSSNAAFTFGPTYPFTECLEAEGEPFREYCTKFPPQKGVTLFTDAKTWYPGMDVVDGALGFRDFDASVVVPSKGDQPYSVRVVHADGTPATEYYGQKIDGGYVLGTGNPGDEGKALGVRFGLVRPLPGNRGAVVHVTPPPKSARH